MVEVCTVLSALLIVHFTPLCYQGLNCKDKNMVTLAYKDTDSGLCHLCRHAVHKNNYMHQKVY